MMKAFAYIFLFLLVAGCQKPEDSLTNQNSSVPETWLVPQDKVLYQGSEKDRIPSIDDPQFIPINESTIKPDERVLVAHKNDVTKVYPISIMDAHEIVNDNINDYYYSLTYCPLTASGMLWDREINGELTEFGVSGMLYNENLMPYDRATESIWSQMENKCVNGNLIGSVPETSALLETKFSTIKNAYPDALVLSHASCDSITCERSGTLKNDPIDGETVTLPFDQLYYGFVKNENVLLFNLKLFSEGTHVVTTYFHGASLIICGNIEHHFFTAFLTNETNKNYNFSAVQDGFPIIIEDNKGNKYDVFGKVVEGPEKGKYLKTANAYHARTFAWELFFKNIEIFE